MADCLIKVWTSDLAEYRKRELIYYFFNVILLITIGDDEMKYSTKLSDAIHILILIALNPLENLTSQTIAESIKTNPSFVRQIMSKLKKYHLIESVHGHAYPCLSKSPKEMTLLDIYYAIEGEKPLLHLDTHTNPECGVGINIQLAIQTAYDRVQIEAEKTMKNITLHDIIDQYHTFINQRYQ